MARHLPPSPASGACQPARHAAPRTGKPKTAAPGIAAAIQARLDRPDRGDAELELVPLFPIDSFTPQSKCPHKGPIPPGSPFICMVCHQSGRDHLFAPAKV